MLPPTMTDSTTTATTATNKPDLLDCDALMLSSYLLHHRFDGDAMATATFLLEATSTLPNAESISAQLLGTSNEEDNMNGSVARAVSTDTAAAAPADFGNALARECAVSMTQPRGKFNMTVYEHGIRCVNAKNQVLSIVPGSVEHLVLFPKPEDCRATSKPSGGDMVLLTLVASDSTAFFNGKTLPQVCFQLAKEPPSSNETWLDTMCSSLSLEKHQVAIVPNPKFKSTNNNNTDGAYSFKSHDEGTTSSTTAGMPYVQCYHGVKDGVIFPMQQGLLFFKYVVQCKIAWCVACLVTLSLTHTLVFTVYMYDTLDHPCFCIVPRCIPLPVDVDRGHLLVMWIYPLSWIMTLGWNLPIFIARNWSISTTISIRLLSPP